MAADEIFILVLIVVCFGSLVAMEVHSRRNRKAAGESEDPPQEGLDTIEPPLAETAPSKNTNRRKRRNR